MFSDPFFSVVATAISVFLVTFLGAYLRKKGRLSDQVDMNVMWLVINILYPSLVVNAMLKNPALDNVENIFLPPVMGFCSVVIGFMLGFLLIRVAKLKNEGEKRSYLLANAINNFGFLPIPLILALYDRETLGVLFVHNIGIDLAIWSFGIVVISKTVSVKQTLKRLLNAPLCAITACLFLTYFDLDEHVPSFVFKTTQLLGQASIPMALMLVGSLMYDAHKNTGWTDGIRLVFTSLAIRVMLFPLCYFALVWLIPMSLELKRVMIVEAAQPAAMLPIVLAKQFGQSTQVAFIVLLATSVASIFTMPLWIELGTRWLL